MSLLKSALNYAKNGIPVFPVHGINDKGTCTCLNPNCPHPGKHPILKGGFKNATCDQQQITTWWKKHPVANIGVPTGTASGWYVVDVDQKNQGIENYHRFVEQHKSEVPEATLKAHTGGGGYHLIYAQPANGQAVGSSTNIGRLEGVDFRGEGGYIVVPPSLHFNQKHYGWNKNFSFNDHHDLAELQELPLIIADLVKNPAKTLATQDSVIEGRRNDYLFKQACKFCREGGGEQLFDLVWAKNKSVCKPPLDQTEVQQIVGSALRTEITPVPSNTHSATGGDKLNPGKGKEDDAFNKLMDITADHEFWVDEAKKEYVTFPVPHKPANGDLNPDALQTSGSHYENWPVSSLEYNHFLNYQYRQFYRKAPPPSALKKVLECLAGDALFSENSYETHVRTARLQDHIFIDLTDEHWNLIEITASGWGLFKGKPPVKFLRSKSVTQMPIPDPSGSFDCLPQVFRLKNHDDYILLAGWMMFALVEGGPYPILTVEGPAGSSKSTLTKQIRQMVDPRKSGLQGLPRGLDDLYIQASNGHLIAIDNLSEIKQGLSDVLCGIATGTGTSKRELYTDAEEVYFEVCNPIILNSINPVVASSDLADRCIRLSLPPISPNHGSANIPNQGRLTAKEVEERFQLLAPKILGAIFNAIQTALPLYEQVKDLPAEIRMADFACWGVAAGEKLATGDRDFMSALMANRRHNAMAFMEENVLNSALLQFMQNKKKWSGTGTQLITELRKIITPQEAMDKSFPKRANFLTRELNKSITTLKQFGIHYTAPDGINHKNRTITLSYTPDSIDAVDIVQSATQFDTIEEPPAYEQDDIPGWMDN